MKITIWKVVKDNGTIVFNHIEDGWSESNFPLPIKPKFLNQQAWKNMNWQKKYAHLINDIVVYI